MTITARFLAFGFLFTAHLVAAYACSPPPPVSLVAGPAGSQVPYYDAEYYAFLGKVMAYGKDPDGNPAVVIEVTDSWTERQSVGSLVTVGVAQWQGCGLPNPMGEPFVAGAYPIGTRVRVAAHSLPILTWDVGTSLSVVGVAL